MKKDNTVEVPLTSEVMFSRTRLTQAYDIKWFRGTPFNAKLKNQNCRSEVGNGFLTKKYPLADYFLVR